MACLSPIPHCLLLALETGNAIDGGQVPFETVAESESYSAQTSYSSRHITACEIALSQFQTLFAAVTRRFEERKTPNCVQQHEDACEFW